MRGGFIIHHSYLVMKHNANFRCNTYLIAICCKLKGLKSLVLKFSKHPKSVFLAMSRSTASALKKSMDCLMLKIPNELQTKYLSSYFVHVLALVGVPRTSLLNHTVCKKQMPAVVPSLAPKKAIRAKLPFIHEKLYLISSSH